MYVYIYIALDKSIENKIQAYDKEIGALALNAEGTLIACASIHGTVIRVFSAEECELL